MTPVDLRSRLRLPLIAAPMFLVSGPELVIAACRAGVLGAFPALNCRTTDDYRAWLDQVTDDLEQGDAPFAVNLIVHPSNARLDADLAVTIERQVPVVITSLGSDPRIVGAVHEYGGLVLHDVVSRRHAAKAAGAGVDGIIAVTAGAGGHTGQLSNFALVKEIREVFDGFLILAGGLATGRDIAAARAMGADLAAMGTRFIATRESLAPEAYKQMLVEANAADIMMTASLTGVAANFLKPSLAANGIDLGAAAPAQALGTGRDSKVWRDIWSAGHGVGAIRDIPGTSELCARLLEEYRAAS